MQKYHDRQYEKNLEKIDEFFKLCNEAEHLNEVEKQDNKNKLNQSMMHLADHYERFCEQQQLNEPNSFPHMKWWEDTLFLWEINKIIQGHINQFEGKYISATK